MNPQIIATFAENLANAFILNQSSATDSRGDSLTTGAVFALARVIHELEEFEAVTALAADSLEMSPAELRELLPAAEDVADSANLIEL